MAVHSSRVTLSFLYKTLHRLAEICICRALSRLGQRPLSLSLDGMWSSFSTVFILRRQREAYYYSRPAYNNFCVCEQMRKTNAKVAEWHPFLASSHRDVRPGPMPVLPVATLKALESLSFASNTRAEWKVVTPRSRLTGCSTGSSFVVQGPPYRRP